MKYIFTTLIFVSCYYISVCQNSIYGTITDNKGEILPFTNISINQGKFEIQSDENGNYRISGINPGQYSFSIDLMGYELFNESKSIIGETMWDIVLQKQSIKIDEIEISATKVSDNMPFTFRNYTTNEINARNYGTDLPYILDNSPSVVTTSDAGVGIGYTGIRLRGTDPTRINITINDIPFNDAESQQVYWVDIPDIASSTGNIQIQRGVGPSTNGAGAFGGTINLETNQFKPDPYANIDLGYGSFNTKVVKAKLGTGLMADKYSLDLRYSLINSDGYIDRAFSKLNSFYFSGVKISKKSSLRFITMLGKEITYQAWDGVPVQYIGIDSLRTYNELGTDYFQHFPPYNNQVDNYTQNHFQLIYNKLLTNNLTMKTALHYTRGYGFYEQYKVKEKLSDYGVGLESDFSDLVRQKWLDNKLYGLTYALKYKNLKSDMILGGAINNYEGNHFGDVVSILNNPNYNANSKYYDGKGVKLDFNTFIKYEYLVSKTLNLLADLQYRFVDYSIFGFNDDNTPIQAHPKYNFFNPKAGFNYFISKHLSAYASYSIGNKEPNRDDFVNKKNGIEPKSEHLSDIEAGIKLKSNKINFGVNFYTMKYKNQLVLTGNLDDTGDPIRENVAKSYRRGIELDMEYRFSDFITFNFNTNISKNKINEFNESIQNWDTGGFEIKIHKNTDIAFSPDLVAYAGINCDILKTIDQNSKHSLLLSFSNKYVAKQYLDNTQSDITSLKPYNLNDLSLTFTPKINKINKLQVSFKINNLFNTDYISNGWSSHFVSSAYNPLPDDPYTTKASNADHYYYIGLFPQAYRNYMIRLLAEFE